MQRGGPIAVLFPPRWSRFKLGRSKRYCEGGGPKLFFRFLMFWAPVQTGLFLCSSVLEGATPLLCVLEGDSHSRPHKMTERGATKATKASLKSTRHYTSKQLSKTMNSVSQLHKKFKLQVQGLFNPSYRRPKLRGGEDDPGLSD